MAGVVDVDLRRLRYFLVLADELHYGRAAEALHLAQPALSRSIATLERELGVTLFERSRSGTRLAPAGELLREEARALLGAADALQRRVRVADREGRSLQLGFMPGLILTPVLRRLEERHPGLRVEVTRTSWNDQVLALRDGRVDASFAHRPFDDDGLRVLELFTENRVVAVAADHPTAASGRVVLEDLAGDLLLQPRGAVPEWPGAAAIPKPPVLPTPGAEAERTPTVEEKLEMVAAGRGVVLLPESASRYYRRPDVRYVRVLDLPDTQVCLLVERRRRSPVLADLLEVAATTSALQYTGVPDADRVPVAP